MAKKPLKRKKRKLPKAKLPAGVTEDEFGELKRKLKPKRSYKPSKTDRRQAEDDIWAVVSRRATQDLHAQEDARVFALLDASFMPNDERVLLEKLKTRLKAAAAFLLAQFEARIDLEVDMLLTDFWAQRKTKRRGKKLGVR